MTDSHANPGGAGDRRLRRQQGAVLLLLFSGYAAYYFCRANLAVATPLIADELQAHGIDRADAIVRIGVITTFGTLAYAVGKLALTGFADLWGGRRVFLMGLAGAIVFTLLFALGGGLPIFTIAWIGNRLTQAPGWAGLLKVCSRWFNFSSYGTIVGILSLSYLVGDMVARQSMGALIDRGAGWRTVFVFAAGVAVVIALFNLVFLRESRTDAGHADARENPLNVFAEATPAPASIGSNLARLLTNGSFVLVCALSFGCTVVRETFNNWTPMYLNQSAGFTVGHAAWNSAIFPAAGAVSVLVFGWLSDRLGANGRALLLFLGLLATTFALMSLGAVRTGAVGASLALVLIAVTAFALIGPYSYLGGAMALDFGGKQAGAQASGIIDGIGYLGGAISGVGVARLSVAFGWHGVFVALALVCAVSAIAAAALWVHQARRMRTRAALA